MNKMTKQLSELISGKRVLILGFGVEGQSSYRLIKEIGTYSAIGVADINAQPEITDSIVHFGAGYLECIDDYDLIIKSPGIALEKSPSEYTSIITSQTELFLNSYREQVIGITGTKGKSTVSSLLYHVLSTNNVPCILAGNIGVPVFDILSDITPDTVIVYEMSCHQLEYCNQSPATAIFLNLFEDHLDRYKTFEAYATTKKNIFLHQKPTDFLYCDESVMPSPGVCSSKTVLVDTDILPFDSLNDIGGTRLAGKHNLTNCAFVYTLAKTYGVTDRGFISSVQSYVPLKHRLEYIGTKNNIDYYDDSISTTVESAISAIESIPNASTILLGGMDRGINYTHLVEYLLESHITNVICMYESGKRIFDALNNQEFYDQEQRLTVVYCADLYEATETAQKITPPGTACILSPASASYGDFVDFAERGDVFRKILFGE
jgi:UDP-N-acetylmuramoylalanine--D-glutamate ligase